MGNRVSVRHTVNHIGNCLVMGEPESKKARRTIVIPPGTLEILSRYRARMERELALRGATVQDSTPMFCDEFGGVRDPKAVLKEFKHLAAAAGMPDCTLHDLRHWHASSLIRAGLDPQAVAERLGHSSANLTLGTYSHAFDEQREKAALTLDELRGGEGVENGG